MLKPENNKYSNLFVNYMNNAVHGSPVVQDNFLKVMLNVSRTVLKILKHANLVIDLDYFPSTFWPQNKDKTIAFVDGGLDKSSFLSSAPLTIRAGSYIVNKALNEEFFSQQKNCLVDLYDQKNDLYDFVDDDSFEDLMLNKKKDAARIIFEASTLVNHIQSKRKIDLCFLHGPIEAILTPFTQQGFPPFTKLAVDYIIPFYKKKKLSFEDRHFINVYLECIKFIKKSPFPIYGVVETAVSAAYTKNLLHIYKNKGIISEKDYRETVDTINRYRITDASLFEVILKKNQALKPIEIQKQFYGQKIIQRSIWDEWVEQYPKVFMGYLKATDNQSPIRIETLNYPGNLINDFKYILAVSKLLPNYGYPIGLNVVDRFVKISNWMSKASRNYFTTHLLKKAINNKDKNTVSLALKVLSKKNRAWMNRPNKKGVKR
tara:strand:- start:359 stop:1651 length:1293 start_codon:yes stop_codon:yes gene_type:complete